MADVKLSTLAAYIKSTLLTLSDTLFMTQAERTKLAGTALGATANQTDTFLLARANHTGSQAISTVTNLQTTLDGKSAVGHGHSIADISTLSTTLASLANKPESLLALTDVDIDTPTPLWFLRWNSAGTAIEQVTPPTGGTGTGGDEVSIADTAALLKVDKLSPTVYHPGPGPSTLAYIRVPVTATLSGIEVVAGSGSGTITVQKNGSAISGLTGMTINTSKTIHSATGTGNDNWLAEGDELRIFLPTSSALVDVRVYPLIVRRY